MTDLETFRAQTRAWLEEHAPASLRGTREGRFDGYWGGAITPAPSPDERVWFERMLARGWTAPTWPTEYGGGGLSRAAGEVLDEELVRLKMPPPLVGFGLTMIGPTLLDYGTAEQKARHIPRIVRGEVRWCQGYSEPGAGSDLASLRTRAVRDGDELIVDGQKVWTSYAHLSDWIFCLTRTNPDAVKQAGITFVLIDMSTPGVTPRPIELISGASPFCEVFLEGVRVPLCDVVGAIDDGWTVAKALLGYERTMIGSAIGGQLRGTQEALVEAVRAAFDAPEGPLPDAHLREAIARNAMDEQAFYLTTQRIAQTVAEGARPGPESSILKVCGSELKQKRWELEVEIAGPQGLGWEGEGYAADELQHTRHWLRSRANTIEGGTSEIQLNILAKRVLGLPS